MRKLLYIDSSYTLAQIRERGLDHVLQIRHLEGYWDQVWSAHPLDLKPGDAGSAQSPFGAPLVERVSGSHMFVRGRWGRFRRLAALAPINALLSLASFARTLRQIVRREGIDTVRAADPLLCGLLGLLVARMAGAQLVVRINGDHDMIRANTGEPIMPRLFRSAVIEDWIERAVLSRADAIVAPSQDYVDFAVRKGADPAMCGIVRYGNLIDPKHFVPPQERSALDDPDLADRLRERPWMLHVGRLHPIKHAEDCLTVLELVAAAGSDAGLCLVGDGPLREVLGAQAAASGLADRVLFLGNRDQDFLSRLIPCCAAVLSPLTGRALSEVAFGGAAIVAYDLDWQGEMVEDGETGILVPPKDVTAMADGVLRLLADSSLADRYGSAVRERAFELLDPAAQTRREIELYQGLGGPARSRAAR